MSRSTTFSANSNPTKIATTTTTTSKQLKLATYLDNTKNHPSIEGFSHRIVRRPFDSGPEVLCYSHTEVENKERKN